MTVLAQITEENLDTGLRGIPVGHCPTSHVDPVNGLSYRGIKIENLSDKTAEEVMYLLFNSKLPNDGELKAFKKELADRSEVHPNLISSIEAFDKNLHPMNRLSIAILLLDQYYPEASYSKASMNLLAKLPEIVATIFRAGHNWGPRQKSKPELGYMANFVQLATGKANEDLTKFMDLFHILHYDHSGGNLSTFVAKSTASGGANHYQSIATCMLSLAGPLHGGANQMVIEFMRETLKHVPDPTNHDALRIYLKKIFAEGKKIFGYGHAVLRAEDKRATLLFDFGKEIAKNDKFYQLSQSLRVVGTEILKENPKVQNPYPNVDAVSGVLLHHFLTQDETYYTVLFGFSRCVGISAQIVYEREQANGGKGVPIMRPKYLYSGPEIK